MGTLHLYLYRHKMLPEEQVRNLMFQIVQAVAGLHRTRIVHRDVKPSNILLQRRTEDTFAYSGGIVVKVLKGNHMCPARKITVLLTGQNIFERVVKALICHLLDSCSLLLRLHERNSHPMWDTDAQ